MNIKKISINRKFKRTKVVGVFLLLASLTFNYILLKDFMTFKCSAGGYFVSKQDCGELAKNLSDSQELARQGQDYLSINSDILK